MFPLMHFTLLAVRAWNQINKKKQHNEERISCANVRTGWINVCTVCIIMCRRCCCYCSLLMPFFPHLVLFLMQSRERERKEHTMDSCKSIFENFNYNVPLYVKINIICFLFVRAFTLISFSIAPSSSFLLDFIYLASNNFFVVVLSVWLRYSRLYLSFSYTRWYSLWRN